MENIFSSHKTYFNTQKSDKNILSVYRRHKIEYLMIYFLQWLGVVGLLYFGALMPVC
jgi:hypothetical protein